MEVTLQKEEEIVKPKRIGVILLSKGKIPSDYPKDKAFEYLLQKLYQNFGLNYDSEKLKRLELEIKNWKRDEYNDPLYSRILNIAKELSFLSGYQVEVAFENLSYPDLEEAFQNLLFRNINKIIILPLYFLEELDERILKEIEKMKEKYKVEIILAWPVDISLQVDYLMGVLIKYIKKVII